MFILNDREVGLLEVACRHSVQELKSLGFDSLVTAVQRMAARLDKAHTAAIEARLVRDDCLTKLATAMGVERLDMALEHRYY